MDSRRMILLIAALITPLCVGNLQMGQSREVRKTFDRRDRIDLTGAIGTLKLQKSDDQKMHVHFLYRGPYPDDVWAEFDDEEDELQLREKIEHGRNFEGRIRWTIDIPDDVEFGFRSGTGDLRVLGLKIRLSCHVGTGNIEVSDCQGEFDLSTGTGKIDVENAQGDFKASSGTGPIDVRHVTLTERAAFRSGTGRVRVFDPRGSSYSLEVSSGTGHALVNLAGQSVHGYFEFTAEKERGRIVSPIEFDKEEEFLQQDRWYVRKSFSRGGENPKVLIKTGTGTAKLELN
jgi:hypothetical protein